jgi:phosphohistidine phosphatase SixA
VKRSGASPAAILRGFVFLGLAWLSAAAAADARLWGELRAGGLVVLIRHADTDPGAGDPPGFDLGDCRTQRNLSATGRAQAKRLGEAFKREKIPVAGVLSSEWCRCRDTATLAFGRYVPWPALNNLFGRSPNEPAQSRAIRERGGAFAGPGNLVLVTHGATILPVADASPATAELVIMRPAGAGKLELVGRMPGD